MPYSFEKCRNYSATTSSAGASTSASTVESITSSAGASTTSSTAAESLQQPSSWQHLSAFLQQPIAKQAIAATNKIFFMLVLIQMIKNTLQNYCLFLNAPNVSQKKSTFSAFFLFPSLFCGQIGRLGGFQARFGQKRGVRVALFLYQQNKNTYCQCLKTVKQKGRGWGSLFPNRFRTFSQPFPYL